MISSNIFNRLILLFFYVGLSHCSPQCLDQNGDPVDWFILYKLPRLRNSTDSYIAAGVGYSFITSKTVNEGWQYANQSIADPKSMPGRTLFPAYDKVNGNDVDDIFYVLYNDQPPSEPFTLKEGHTKGIILGDNQGGIWIVHSVPKFPTIDDLGYQYPSTGRVYGQSFLCMNLDKKNLNIVANQLIVNWANVYDYKLDGVLSAVYPDFLKVAKMERQKTVQSKVQFSSTGNVLFTSFAKSPDFGKDLYSKWVAQDLGAELFVESWLHEHTVPSDCADQFEVHNIMVVSMKASHCRFSSYKDHSKFAVSGNMSNPWVCIGDINRATEQYIRAGGTVCFQNLDVWPSYRKLVAAFEPCPKKKNRVHNSASRGF